MNLIPEKNKADIYDYFCTWGAQKDWGTLRATAEEMRSSLNGEFLFGKNGVLDSNDSNIRRDMLVLLDDGWDVPPGLKHDSNDEMFGSMVVNAEKFSEFAELKSYDRLKALSDKIKQMGYAGTGLWVPANHYGEKCEDERSHIMKEAEIFWTDRAKMCAYADIKYLKIDWGYHGRDVEYRKLITDIMRKYSPGTKTEHVIGLFGEPYDPSPKRQNTERFRTFMELAKDTVKISDFYRTYDVLDELSEATTLMRIVKLAEVSAEADRDYLGIINVEDNPVIAAVFGMTTGIMRHKNRERYEDSINTLIWHRIAPPNRFEPTKLISGDMLACDVYKYNNDPSVWPYIGKKTIKQYAPSVISYNAPLAEVESCDEYTPFVINAKNSVTGAYSVAVIEINKENKKYYPNVSVSVSGADINAPVGIFGKFEKLEICFEQNIEGKKVYMQKMSEYEAEEITEKVKIKGEKIEMTDFNLRAAVLKII